MTIIDLTHELDQQTPVYPGTQERAPSFIQTASVDADGYSNSILITGMHLGTHIDAPAHMLEKGQTIDMVPLTQLCCRAYVIQTQDKNIIEADLIENIDFETPCALLFHTGYDTYYGQERYFIDHPVLSERTAHVIIAKKIGIVGFDSPSPDRFPFSIHKLLFSHNIPIIENLTHIHKLLGAQHIMLYALPIKSKTDSALARVIAVISK